jgi:uncharacterized protein YneF (UPF0154 family)
LLEQRRFFKSTRVSLWRLLLDIIVSTVLGALFRATGKKSTASEAIENTPRIQEEDIQTIWGNSGKC